MYRSVSRHAVLLATGASAMPSSIVRAAAAFTAVRIWREIVLANLRRA